MKIIILIGLSLTLAFSCGKKNEVGEPQAPINGIGFQNSNLLSPYDPSFENQTNPQRNLAPIGRIGRPTRITTTNRFFRVTGTSNRGNRNHEITQVAARSGNKSLRLFMANGQTLIMPISTARKDNPLKLVSGARYRYQANVRLPRNVRNIPRGTIEARFKNGLNFSGRTRTTLAHSGQDNNGWYTMQAEFEVPSLADSAKLYLQLNGSNDLLIDDLSLIRIR